MKREAIIFAGIGILVLDFICHAIGIEHTDPAFWYIMVPIGLVLGGMARKLYDG